MTESLNLTEPQFALGQLVATPAALALVDELNLNLFVLVRRHQRLDSDVCAEDAQANRAAVMHGGRVLSSFHLVPGRNDATLWAITESDRSTTTLLLPEEY